MSNVKIVLQANGTHAVVTADGIIKIGTERACKGFCTRNGLIHKAPKAPKAHVPLTAAQTLAVRVLHEKAVKVAKRADDTMDWNAAEKVVKAAKLVLGDSDKAINFFGLNRLVRGLKFSALDDATKDRIKGRAERKAQRKALHKANGSGWDSAAANAAAVLAGYASYKEVKGAAKNSPEAELARKGCVLAAQGKTPRVEANAPDVDVSNVCPSVLVLKEAISF